MTCEEIVERWLVSEEVAARFLLTRAIFHQRTGRDLSIISGHRSCEKQEELARRGRPAAPCNVSNHTTCPARAVDVRPSGPPVRTIRADLGRAAIEAGFRWGGGSPVDEGGIPSDWNHLDLGPRR